MRGARGSGASGSSTIRTRLFVPGGSPVHSRGGETSLPSQVKRAGIAPPGAKADEVSANPMGSSSRSLRLSPLEAPQRPPHDVASHVFVREVEVERGHGHEP